MTFLLPMASLPRPCVFPRKAVEDVTMDLMSENGIPKRGTDDVMGRLELW